MEFARPIGALALLSLPIILWLHRSRRRAPDQAVPSLQPWRILFAPAPKRRSVPPSLLLALRLAAAAALALALLEPRAAGQAGDREAEDLVLVLDTTTSMSAGDRWNQALDHGRAAIATAAGLGPISIVTLGPRPRAIVVREGDPARALIALQSLDPGGVGQNFGEVETLLDGVMGDASRAVVISDLPVSAAPLIGDRAEWLTVGAPLDNLAIVGIRAASEGGSTVVSTRVANFGSSEAELTIELSLDDAPLAERDLTLEARSIREIDWRTERTARRASVVLRTAAGARDALPADDVAYAVLEQPDVPVQLVGRSAAFERALAALDDVTIERAGLGTLRTPGEGGVAVFVGTAPEHPPTGGLIYVPEPGDPAADSAPQLLRLEGAGLHPLFRGLDFAGAMIDPTAMVESAAHADAGATLSLLEADGVPVVLSDSNLEGGARAVYLGFNPDGGDLHSRAAFPLLVARLIAYAAPQRPPPEVTAGEWIPLPPWPVELSTPNERFEVAGHGSDATSRPGWYAFESVEHDGPPIGFAVNAGDSVESDLSGAGQEEEAPQPASRGLVALEWWRVALLVALTAAFVESVGRPTASFARRKDA